MRLRAVSNRNVLPKEEISMLQFKSRIAGVAILVLVAMPMLAACGAEATPTPPPAPTDTPAAAPAATDTPAAMPATGGKIAILLPETKTARYESQDLPNFKAKLKSLGFDVEKNLIYSNANQDAAAQQQ